MLWAGLDVSATRGLDMAVIDGAGDVRLVWLPDHRGLLRLLHELGTEVLLGIDAPSALARQPGGRQAERELQRRNVALYRTPTADGTVDTWMAAGFEVWRIAREAGLIEQRERGGERGAIEVYPYLAYVCWTGKRRPPTEIPRAWATALVRGRGIQLPSWAVKDHADAVSAALVARAYAANEAVPFGDPLEGVIWAPSPPPFWHGMLVPSPPTTAPRLGSPCLCGCGEKTSGRKGVVWRSGHDMRGRASDSSQDKKDPTDTP